MKSDKEENMKAEVIATDKGGLDVDIEEQCRRMSWTLGTTGTRSTRLDGN